MVAQGGGGWGLGFQKMGGGLGGKGEGIKKYKLLVTELSSTT